NRRHQMADIAPTSDAGFFRERGFLQRMGFGRKPALVVIDMQKGFTHPDQPLGSNLDAQIDSIGELLNIAHAREIPVYFTVCSYEGPNFQDAGVWIRKIGGLASLEAGTP